MKIQSIFCSQNHWRISLALLIFILFVLPLESLGQPDDEIHRGLMERPGASGKDLFIANRCVRCHTVGRGRFVGPDLEDVAGRYTRDEIIGWMTDPQAIYSAKGKMPVNDGYPPMPPLGVQADTAGRIADFLIDYKLTVADRAKGGTIKGVVLNRTADAPIGGHEVTLKAFMGDNERESYSAKTDDNGRFTFSNLIWARSYALHVDYKGGIYQTDKMVFAPSEDMKTLDLPVFEPTSDPAGISVSNSHIIFMVQEEKVSVTEVVVFSNPNKTMYVGEALEAGNEVKTLNFRIPKDAAHLTLYEGLDTSRVVESDNGFFDTSPLAPGFRRVIFNYLLPLSAVEAFVKEFDYFTHNFSILVADSGTEITVKGLARAEPIDIEGERFLSWEGTGLSPGDTVVVEMRFPEELGDRLVWIVGGVMILIILCGIAFSMVNSRRRDGIKTENEAQSKTDEPSAKAELEVQKQRLVEEIAELDKSFEAGDASEEDYQSQREDKKRRLIDIMEKLDDNPR